MLGFIGLFLSFFVHPKKCPTKSEKIFTISQLMNLRFQFQIFICATQSHRINRMCPGFQLLIFQHLSCRAFLSVCVYKCTGASISAILLRSSKAESGRKFLHHRLSHISVKEQNQIFILNTFAQWHVCCLMQTSSWMAAFVEQSCEVLRLILASSPSPMTIREGGTVGGGGGGDGVVTGGRGRSSVTLRRRRLSAKGIHVLTD